MLFFILSEISITNKRTCKWIDDRWRISVAMTLKSV